MKSVEPHHPAPLHASMPVRLVYAALGLVSVGLGVLGVFLPGLPTTIFLIIASYLLTRSCPWLEKKVMGLRIFKPFIPYMRRDRPMPRKAKITALAMMWPCVTVSLLLLAQQGAVVIWVHVAIVTAAIVGTVFILRS